MQYLRLQLSKSNSLAVMTYPSHLDGPDKTPVRFRVGLKFLLSKIFLLPISDIVPNMTGYDCR